MNPRHNARKVCCPDGHAYDEANTLRRKLPGKVRRDGQPVVTRTCRTCERNRQRTRRAQLAAARSNHSYPAAVEPDRGTGSLAALPGSTGRVPAGQRGPSSPAAACRTGAP